jgi:hypothetical protein
MQNAYKILTRLIANRLYGHVERLLCDEQYGFRKTRSTCDAIWLLKQDINQALSVPRNPLYACFIDFRKAFDSVKRPILIRKLIEQFNVKGPVLRLLCSILKENFATVDATVARAGLPPVKILLYADDLVLYSTSREAIQ